MKKSMVFVVVIALAALIPTGANAQCLKGNWVANGAGNGGIIGGLVGALAGGNRKSALYGMAAGAGAGVIANLPCRKHHSNARQERAQSAPRPAQPLIAAADAPTAPTGPSVMMRNIPGIDRSEMQPIVVQALYARGYSLIDGQYNRQVPTYYLDITVSKVSDSNGNSGGGFSTSPFGFNGNRNAGSSIYLVAVEMINAQTGIVDPSRTAHMTIGVEMYRSTNGSMYAASSINGYGSHSYWATNPATGAAMRAIDHFFGLN